MPSIDGNGIIAERLPGRVVEGANGSVSVSASPISRVEPHEAQAAEFIVYENFKNLCGKYPPRVAGYFVLVKIYQRDPLKKITRDDGTEVEFYKHTDRTTNEDKYQSVVGLVVGMGAQAYTGTNLDGSQRFPTGPWCRVGDWIAIPRYEGFQITFCGVPLLVLPDDKVLLQVDEPADIIATHLLDR